MILRDDDLAEFEPLMGHSVDGVLPVYLRDRPDARCAHDLAQPCWIR